MSLAEQSQQWYPTSVQVTVLQARGLRIKGKNGTNDAYAVMQVAKDKFSTSVAEKSVAPVWKEEASFDLPLFHPSNAERCALQVSVMHRALVGPDKLLGLTVVNLLELNDNKSRNKSEWFKLMGKAGKPDKDRGEVLLDIQFMKNNMTASMYDLSGQDKSRSRLGKFKDKLKGKKKDGMSDSASAIVPSVGQILTDSEGDEEADATPGTKKKSKLKSLFAPKGLHRNMSQSMSTLATLPEKDSAISLSRSSGLNVESPEAKKKFRLFKHKRTGSSDSKVSQGAGSIGQGMTQSNLCINGSHVYTEEPETRDSRAGSTFSLNSSGHGSMEDVRNRKISTTSVDSLKASDLQTQESAMEEMHRRQEEQRKQEEEVRKRVEEERRRQIEEEEREQLRREEMRKEEERKRVEREEERRQIERELEKRRLEEQEEERRRIEREEEKKRLEKLEEERKRIEKEEEMRRLEEQEEEMRWIEREEEKRRLEKQEEERRRIEQEMEEQRRIAEEMERKEELARIKREQEKARQEEERKRTEEERMREERMKLEKQAEERKRIEQEMEEQRRIAEEIEKKEELAKIKREQEKARQEEERKRAEEERMREEEEERIREERRKRMEEEEKTRLEKERMRKEEEMRRTELERQRAEEEERLLKEKGEAEEMRKRKEEEERRMMEEKEQKEKERLRLEKERMELERKEKEEKERMRKKEEEEKKKAEQERIRREKDELEKQKKEQINVTERPDVKPRSARMNTSKRAEKPEIIGSVSSSSPFEDDFLLDETSTSFYEQSVLQPEALRSSAKVSAVKPSSSISGKFFLQASVPNTNPFLDDSDASSDGNIVKLGDDTERAEKKRRAPMPPQNKTEVGQPDVPPRDLQVPPSTPVSGAVQTPYRASAESGDPDVSSSRRDKRPAPLPPDVSKNRYDVLNKERADQSTTSLLEETNPFVSPGVRTAKHNKGPAPAKPLIQSTSRENSVSVPEPNNLTISCIILTDESSCLDQLDESSNQLCENFDNVLLSKETVCAESETVSCSTNASQNTENVSLESVNMTEASKKKSQAPLPPVPLGMNGDQKSTKQQLAAVQISHSHGQDQDRTLTNNNGPPNGPPTSSFCPPVMNSSSNPSQAPETEEGQRSENKSLPQARVSPIDAQPVAGQTKESERKRTGDPDFKPCRPHAVKPLSSTDNQPDFKENQDNFASAKIADGVQVKMKAPQPKAAPKGTGPYSQLTHEELVNLLEKQKVQLSQKDAKIMELEQYIDNLLVRVIEEKPSILMTLTSMKKSV